MVFYFVKNFIRGKRRVKWLIIEPTDQQLSLAEWERLRDLRDCMASSGKNVHALCFNGINRVDSSLALVGSLSRRRELLMYTGADGAR